MTDNPTRDQAISIAAEQVFGAALDSRIRDMRRIVRAMQPGSTAAALRILRDEFPDVPLEARIKALGEIRR